MSLGSIKLPSANKHFGMILFNSTILTKQGDQEMTFEEFGKLLTDHNVKDGLFKRASRTYPKERSKRVWDWVQRAIRDGLTARAAGKYNDPAAMMDYMSKRVINVAKDEFRKEDRRRELRLANDMILNQKTRGKDPMRHIDYKIDLEKAIESLGETKDISYALWTIYYEGALWDDVVAEREKGLNDKGDNSYRSVLIRASNRLKEEMRRKTYYRIGSHHA